MKLSIKQLKYPIIYTLAIYGAYQIGVQILGMVIMLTRCHEFVWATHSTVCSIFGM